MIILIHGNNQEASRTEYNRLKQQATGKDLRVLDGRTMDPVTLTQAVQSHSLLGTSTVVCIENLFSKIGKKQKLIETYCAILKDGDAILWEEKEISPFIIKALGKADIKLYKFPTLLFQFLDNPTLPSYQKLVEREAPELVHTMLTRRIRQLILLVNNMPVDELQDWQRARLTRQAKSFTMEKLLTMYTSMLDIEYSIKSGASPFNLAEQTEQFLLSI